MLKRSSSKQPAKSDSNVTASNVVKRATAATDAPGAAPTKNPAAVALGRLGGLKGGKARAKALSPDQRSEIARTAALARWKKSGSKDTGDDR